MCNHERLLDYLYDEMPASERPAFEQHLQECSRCQTELAELGGARLALASWSPPESELGFRIVRREAAAPVPQPARWQLRPAWGLAAAAVLVLAVAAAIANVEVRYDSNGLVVRTGWARGSDNLAQPAIGATAATAIPVNEASEEWKERVQRLDARLQQLERPVQAATVRGDGTQSDGRMSDAELLRTVRRIIAESETRQERQLALRVAQVVRDFDTNRAGDLARIEQGLRQIQGLTDAELIQHRNTLNHLLRVTQQR
jgi:anti-sigma factor RsiW